MTTIETFFLLLLGIQFLHSIEELTHGFHKKYPLIKMTFSFFLTFEIVFFLFWAGVFFLLPVSDFRTYLLATFLILMFANGVSHLFWWQSEKKYIPGLITAFLHVGVFLAFYFDTLL